MLAKKIMLNISGALATIFSVLVFLSIIRFNIRNGYGWLFYLSVAILFVFAVLLVCLTAYKCTGSAYLFISAVTFLACALRTLWIIKVPTAPISDFMAYNTYGYYIAKGFLLSYDPTYVVFPFKIGYPFLLAFMYRLTGISLASAEVLTILSSALTLLLIYAICKNMHNEKTARIACILFAVWPAQIMYSSVLASEHIFMVFFLLALLLLLKLTDKRGGLLLYALPVGIGITLTAAQFIRPISIMLLPIAAVYILFFCEPDGKPFIKIVKRTGMVVMVFACYFLSLNALNAIVEPLTEIDITKSSPGFNLLVGTNYESSGRLSKVDEKIIQEFQYDRDKIHSEALRRATDRIIADPDKFFFDLAVKKHIIQWGDENYGYAFSTAALVFENSLTDLIKNTSLFSKVSQLFYMLMVLLMLIGCIFSILRRSFKSIVLFALIIGFEASYTFFEVQSRYHFPAMLLFIILAAVGAIEISALVPKAKNNSDVGTKDITVNKPDTAKLVASFTAITLLFCAATIALGPKQSGINELHFMSDGNEIILDSFPVPFRNSVYVSVNDIQHILGVSIENDLSSESVIIRNGARKLTYMIGSKNVLSNGEIAVLSAPVRIINNSAYVPLRFTAENLGFKVDYEAAGNTIKILTK